MWVYDFYALCVCVSHFVNTLLLVFMELQRLLQGTGNSTGCGSLPLDYEANDNKIDGKQLKANINLYLTCI